MHLSYIYICTYSQFISWICALYFYFWNSRLEAHQLHMALFRSFVGICILKGIFVRICRQVFTNTVAWNLGSVVEPAPPSTSRSRYPDIRADFPRLRQRTSWTSPTWEADAFDQTGEKSKTLQRSALPMLDSLDLKSKVQVVAWCGPTCAFPTLSCSTFLTFRLWTSQYQLNLGRHSVSTIFKGLLQGVPADVIIFCKVM